VDEPKQIVPGTQPGEGIEKYRELYNYSKEVLAEEQSRFARLDQKASTYLAALTLAFAIYGLIATQLLGVLAESRNAIDWVLLGLVVTIPVLFVVAWVEVFRVLKIQHVRRPPLGDKLLRFFDENRLIDIYYALARACSSALDENRAVADHKGTCLQRAYRWMRIAVVALVALLVLFGVRWVFVR
jgi:hypothetical protein